MAKKAKKAMKEAPKGMPMQAGMLMGGKKGKGVTKGKSMKKKGSY